MGNSSPDKLLQFASLRRSLTRDNSQDIRDRLGELEPSVFACTEHHDSIDMIDRLCVTRHRITFQSDLMSCFFFYATRLFYTRFRVSSDPHRNTPKVKHRDEIAIKK